MPRWKGQPLVPIAVIVFSLQAAGCSGSATKSETAPTGGPTAKESLEDLVRLLEHFKNENKKAPARLAQIEAVEPVFPGAYLGLVQENIVYVWGLPLKPSAGDKVLAFEKNAGESARWVLMQDGTVKRMSEAEFSAAAKAKS